MLAKRYSKYKNFAGKQPLFGKDIILSSYRGGEEQTEVSIPEDFSIIGESAFRECRNITAVIVPDSVREIQNSAFAWCSGLQDIRLPETLPAVSDGLFFTCGNIRSVTLPPHIESLGEMSFSECSSLETLTLPDGLKKIGKRCFQNCTSLRKIHLPDSVENIGQKAFANCRSLTDINLPEKCLSAIGKQAFSGCSALKKVVLPESITEIPDGLFSGCTSLEEVIIPEGVEAIGEEAFMFCSSLKKIHLPNSTRKIGARAFCDSLNLHIEIPANAKQIGMDALAQAATISIYGLPYPLVLPCKYVSYIERNLNQLLESLDSPNSLDTFLNSTSGCWREWSLPLLCYGLSVFPHADKLSERSILWAERLAELFCKNRDGETALKNLIARNALPQGATERLLAQIAHTKRSDLTAMLMEYKNRQFGFRSVENNEDDLL